MYCVLRAHDNTNYVNLLTKHFMYLVCKFDREKRKEVCWKKKGLKVFMHEYIKYRYTLYVPTFEYNTSFAENYKLIYIYMRGGCMWSGKPFLIFQYSFEVVVSFYKCIEKLGIIAVRFCGKISPYKRIKYV